MITVTQPALEKLKEVLSNNENPEKSMLRIQIEGYG